MRIRSESREGVLKVLTQYEEASGDPRVIPVMQKYFAYELRELPKRPLRDWGRYRWQDNVYSVLWLYNRTGDPHLLELAKLLHAQGYDWEKQFASFRYTSKESREALHLLPDRPIPDDAMQTHGVNNAMAIKAAPIWWLLSGSSSDRQEIRHQLSMLDRYHGLPNGMFSGDEHFAGADPSQGIELCAVVETMFSLEQTFAILGDARWADRLERVAYNALPGTLSNDMWSHQYDQQPNQIACTRAHRQWSTNGDDSNLFGLEPNFGCCTANLHQGWPKLTESLWMGTPDGGLVAAVYAPSTLRAKLPAGNVTIDEDTAYPFRGTVRFTIHSAHPIEFDLLLRVPDWAQGTEVQVNATPFNVPQPDCRARKTPAETDAQTCDTAKSFYAIRRNWKDGDQVNLELAMPPRVTRWYHASAVFERGPLVFSLPLHGDWTKLKQYGEKSADWKLTPTTAWNFAVETGECDAAVTEHSTSAVPFDAGHAAVTVTVKARKDPAWTEHESSAGPLPAGPVQSKYPVQELTLVPYGAAKLRITEFPVLTDQSRCTSALRANRSSTN